MNLTLTEAELRYLKEYAEQEGLKCETDEEIHQILHSMLSFAHNYA
ncbi:hypothetical protein [Domibacillus robiginosus]|nr:hypothetical protein [Domibacillus robiginosus]